MTDDFLEKRERFFSLAGYAITRWAYIDRDFALAGGLASYGSGNRSQLLLRREVGYSIAWSAVATVTWSLLM